MVQCNPPRCTIAVRITIHQYRRASQLIEISPSEFAPDLFPPAFSLGQSGSVCSVRISAMSLPRPGQRESQPSSSSSSSTPKMQHPQHSAVSRLKNRGSFTPPAGSTNHGEPGFSTPPPRGAARRSSPAGNSSSPSLRTPIQSTPSRRKGNIRIAQPADKAWYSRWDGQIAMDLQCHQTNLHLR